MTGTEGSPSPRIVVSGFSAATMEAVAGQLQRRGVPARYVPLAGLDGALRPDDTVILMEADAGEQPTIAAGQAARRVQPDIGVLLLTRLPSGATQHMQAEVRGAGWVTFDQDIEEIIAALQRVHDGHDVVQQLPPGPSEQGPTAAAQLEAARLSDREHDVLRGLLTGGPSHAIAEALGISHNTVRTHVRNLTRKLQVESRSDAVALGRDAGLQPLEPGSGTSPEGSTS